MSRRLEGKHALITGASSGIGKCIASQLAEMGANVTVVARRKDRLEKLADELKSKHQVAASVVAQDLAEDDAAQKIWDRCQSPLDIVVNNAGFGTLSPFSSQSEDGIAALIAVNISALTELSHHFVTERIRRGEGGYLLQVASIAAFQSNPYFAVYGAAKAYVCRFSEALDFELKGTDISSTCLCPGATRTEFVEHAGVDVSAVPAIGRATFMSAEKTAAIGIKAMLKRKRLVVAGAPNKFAAFGNRFVPSTITTALASKMMGGRKNNSSKPI